MADLSSLLCLCVLRASPLHSVITLTRFTLALRSGRTGEPWALRSEPDGVLEGDTDWLCGQPVSSIVDRHTDDNSQEQAAWGRERTQAVDQSSRFSSSRFLTDSTVVPVTFHLISMGSRVVFALPIWKVKLSEHTQYLPTCEKKNFFFPRSTLKL